MNKLFDEFQPVSAKAWKQKIQVDLKGADYNDSLVYKTNDGININPIYNKESVHNVINITTNENWDICQKIYVNDSTSGNSKALQAIQGGAESVKFYIPTNTISVNDLIQNIDTNISIHIETPFLCESFTENLCKLSSSKTIYYNNDIIGNLAKSGNWHKSLQDDFTTLNNIIIKSSNLKNCLSVNTTLYQNAGATCTQQIAYALAHVNEYLNYFKDNFPKTIVFNVAIGSNYFLEIAKLRALRLLWNILANDYSINSKCHIFATPSKRNKTIYDYNTNMLRTTTECMSAILGSANTICNLPYDALYHSSNEFGDRIARNQLLILKKESYFSAVSNPSDGSYYIESLTQQLAEKALVIFKQIENTGGFLKQLKEGVIQKKIKESAKKEQNQFDAKEIILLGTNIHPNPDDKMKNELEIHPFVKHNPRKTLIEPILEKRLAEQIEQKRLQTEK